ncbi:MAG TPA: hypothetical protein PLD20_33950 [Blastocatellia bacterium]|nr:hypothetical protein [Blastocatellia bacterium]HMV84999.1 hypothetical protein [Blastocatellia bacterium]HMX30078.1 hypothetical protein [Blastocatellia bacterium]HMY71550.1 hypothetical protein [Blastocatellia bacterium]HMZ22977.1 hypothetical protein [Blastocatellia bacterium]
MIADPKTTARSEEEALEPDTSSERSSAPTLRDLQAAAKKLFAVLMTEPDSVLAEIINTDCPPCQSNSGN